MWWIRLMMMMVMVIVVAGKKKDVVIVLPLNKMENPDHFQITLSAHWDYELSEFNQFLKQPQSIIQFVHDHDIVTVVKLQNTKIDPNNYIETFTAQMKANSVHFAQIYDHQDGDVKKKLNWNTRAVLISWPDEIGMDLTLLRLVCGPLNCAGFQFNTHIHQLEPTESQIREQMERILKWVSIFTQISSKL